MPTTPMLAVRIAKNSVTVWNRPVKIVCMLFVSGLAVFCLVKYLDLRSQLQMAQQHRDDAIAKMWVWEQQALEKRIEDQNKTLSTISAGCDEKIIADLQQEIQTARNALATEMRLRQAKAEDVARQKIEARRHKLKVNHRDMPIGVLNSQADKKQNCNCESLRDEQSRVGTSITPLLERL